jgi:hypothetical protein
LGDDLNPPLDILTILSKNKCKQPLRLYLALQNEALPEEVRWKGMKQLPLKRTVKGRTVPHTREQYIRVFISLVAGYLPANKQRPVTVREKVSGGGRKSLEIGSRDLILCWFLLFQFGHLYDGHIAERYFLYQLFR